MGDALFLSNAWELIDGINEPELSELSLEILDYAERIVAIFDKIDEKIEQLPSSYKSQAYDAFLESYNSFRQNYSTVRDNVISYSDEIITLIRRLHENEKKYINKYENYTKDSISQAKKIEIK